MGAELAVTYESPFLAKKYFVLSGESTYLSSITFLTGRCSTTKYPRYFKWY